MDGYQGQSAGSRQLKKYESFTRREVHDFFEPRTPFTPQRGTWGFHGIIPIRGTNDYVFFVTLGRKQSHHEFDEYVTKDGVMYWQSQPKQNFRNRTIRSLIGHDHERNNIYLFLRANTKRLDYTYLGKLAYISHHPEWQEPVYFTWKILDWTYTQERAIKIGLRLVDDVPTDYSAQTTISNELIITDPPARGNRQDADAILRFEGVKIDHPENNQRNKEIGDLGERLVLAQEIRSLQAVGREDLASRVEHTAQIVGDGTGFDIKSFFPDGRVKFIEVKTTVGNERSPFYLSLKELLFSTQQSQNYCLYRVFEYNYKQNTGKYFVYHGDLSQFVDLQAIQYRALLP
ncbi:DUF3427 domain-containing protein [Paenibacillus mucilaginosus]|uniref:Uncharacterized protein n=1 Tax=Paenibacillus mucilaginosus (strain KNP414) TaxID=1036673 RepID=F8FHA0_PAEMK|nr:DUF3427 domain-containing protein [Paenibacillus mucilaginosus]AEI39802.1 hypothetical protein KNP414_01235 [Paenibacillus mucilaginosus KNP414]MCG7217889.1 DUF3427 domain-containing protein [Paenibacillus mucilaginosus]WDM29087.1 DUF3427 domain-containing protein [Paenibacillus mucilaginosus]